MTTAPMQSDDHAAIIYEAARHRLFGRIGWDRRAKASLYGLLSDPLYVVEAMQIRGTTIADLTVDRLLAAIEAHKYIEPPPLPLPVDPSKIVPPPPHLAEYAAIHAKMMRDKAAC